jgi:hypothetical protein
MILIVKENFLYDINLLTMKKKMKKNKNKHFTEWEI